MASTRLASKTGCSQSKTSVVRKRIALPGRPVAANNCTTAAPTAATSSCSPAAVPPNTASPQEGSSDEDASFSIVRGERSAFTSVATMASAASEAGGGQQTALASRKRSLSRSTASSVDVGLRAYIYQSVCVLECQTQTIRPLAAAHTGACKASHTR